MDCSLPFSSVHGILQARILDWVVISSSRGSSQPRAQTRVSCIGRQILYCLSHQGSPVHHTSVKKIKKKRQRNQKKRDRAFGWDIIACEAEWRPWGSRKAFSCPRILLHHFHRTHKWVAAPESCVIHMVGMGWGWGRPTRRCSARMRTKPICSVSPPESPEWHCKQHCYLVGRWFPYKLFPSFCLCKHRIHREAGKRNYN